MQTGRHKYSLRHRLVILNNVKKMEYTYMGTLEECECCGTLSEFSITQSEIQKTVASL